MSFAKSKRFSYPAAPYERDNVDFGGSRKKSNWCSYSATHSEREHLAMRKDVKHSKSMGSGDCVSIKAKSYNYKGRHKGIYQPPGRKTSHEYVNTNIFTTALFEQPHPWDDLEGKLEKIKEECASIDHNLKKYQPTKERKGENPQDDSYLILGSKMNDSIEDAAVKIKKLFEETVVKVEDETRMQLDAILKNINKNNQKIIKEAENKCQKAMNDLNEAVNEMIEKVSSKQEVFEYESDNSLDFEDAISDCDDFNLDSSLISSDEYSYKQDESSEEGPELKLCFEDKNLYKERSMSDILPKVPVREYIHKGYEKIKTLCKKSFSKWPGFKGSLQVLSKNVRKWKIPYDDSVLKEKEKKIAEQADMINVLIEEINAGDMKQGLCRVLRKQKRET